MNFNECMEFISSYSRLGGRVTDLSRAQELMERIGNPEKRLKFVHIAGTNGKGSTLEYIANALTFSGYRTGRLTSPFVTHYTDRIRIDDREIDEEALGEICGYVAERVADRKYSQFEITMAIAFLWFEREKCDVVVLETGIGGLLDSTNVIPPPLVAVITSISYDHMDILGNTIEEIAAQKAGIIKKGSIIVLSPDNRKDISKIVRKTAENKGSFFSQPVQGAIKICDKSASVTCFSYTQSFRRRKYKLSMAGIFQVYNAVTAIDTCFWLKKRYGFEISQENIERAIETTRVKGRMQYIYSVDKPTVLVDGGHNSAGIYNLKLELAEWKKVGKKLYIIMGMVDTKVFEYSVLTISAFAEKMFCVDGFAGNSVPAAVMAEIAGEHAEAEAISSLSEAVEKARALATENNGIVVVCGSLYLASDYLNMSEK